LISGVLFALLFGQAKSSKRNLPLHHFINAFFQRPIFKQLYSEVLGQAKSSKRSSILTSLMGKEFQPFGNPLLTRLSKPIFYTNSTWI